jgi:glycosyltransferase involved in cell wall biosynthesis
MIILDNSKTLTIAIPTYNGGAYIGRAINSVLDQIKNNPSSESKIEIVVSDNASQDNVEDIVKKYIVHYPNIVKYYRNEINVGFDRNVDLAVRKAMGEFVWILSDDDFLIDGAIVYVQRVIENNKRENLALIYVDCESETKLNNEKDYLCENGDKFFQKTQFKSGLISLNIVSKSIWQESRVERFFDTGWVHFGFGLEALNPLNGFNSYIINKKLVKTGVATRWGHNGTFIDVGLKLVEIFNLMPQWGYTKKNKIMADFVIRRAYPRLIPLAKAKGLIFNFKLLSQFYTLYKQYPSFWLIDLPLLIIPQKVYYFLYMLKQSFKKVNKNRC